MGKDVPDPVVGPCAQPTDIAGVARYPSRHPRDRGSVWLAAGHPAVARTVAGAPEIGQPVAVDEAAVRAKLERHWEYSGTDEDIAHEIYHDDAVLEFPQSGERFEGVDNFREWRRQYPAKLAFRIRRIRGRGDLWVAENSIRYDDGPWNLTVSILEFRGEKVARESIYITQAWEPPDWRAPWRAAP